MPGYSGTPLPKKLGIKDGFRVRLVNMPPDVKKELKSDLAKCEILSNDAADVDFAITFTKTQNELESEFKRVAKVLSPAGMFWVSWPKKSSGVATNVTENMVRDTGLAVGLVDVKVCAITDIWSGLKFMRRLKDRK
jgi:Protein of unknown function (DUF3052)